MKISINLLSEKLVQKLREKGCYIYASDVENISNIGIFLENGVYGMVFNKPPQAGQKKEIEKFAVKSKIIAIEDLQKYSTCAVAIWLGAAIKQQKYNSHILPSVL